ncbi:MAG: type III pantothenate kinase [Acidobacteriota bacterium]|nr:type III pantothenate kinase [Acidobacteriota bacterium]MDQ7086729.1 type III pantothenate kinase [Acidobacteriota bacterium]
MLLVVDIGNTQIVAGVFDGKTLRGSWRLSSRREMTADEFAVLLRGALGEAAAGIESAVMASVVPPLTGEGRRALARLVGKEPLLVEPGIRTGLKIRTDSPQEVGADRIVNAVAALESYGGPAVVVDFGTATTLDVMTASGEYLGGVITVGARVGVDALSVRAARLPRVDLALPPRVIGRNTMDSIRSGALYGHAAMVDGLVERIEEELGETVTVVVTGGTAGIIGPLMKRIDFTNPHLTLEGLRILHARNSSR